MNENEDKSLKDADFSDMKCCNFSLFRFFSTFWIFLKVKMPILWGLYF